jgi:hypothetical protein
MVLDELTRFRHDHSEFARQVHPANTCISLLDLLKISDLVEEPLFRRGVEKLIMHHPDLVPLPFDRIWVAIASTLVNWHGGFHQPDQGYRHIQMTALLSIVSPNDVSERCIRLATLELLRAYIHDSFHYNAARGYTLKPTSFASDKNDPYGFYRHWYGINFRRSDGASYSEKDPVSRKTTRNLGVIMEAAGDREAQEIVRELSTEVEFYPPSQMANLVYMDCTGSLMNEDIESLRALEKGNAAGSFSASQLAYLKGMRLFSQYVSARYRSFLAEFDSVESSQFHQIIVNAMMTGHMRSLTEWLDARCGQKRAFVKLFMVWAKG